MNDSAPSLSKLQHEKSLRKPYAGNLQVRFDEEEGAARPPLLTLLVQNRFLDGPWLKSMAEQSMASTEAA